MNTPVVSVVMITYGHASFIEEAINGVLMQECNFDYELIISNDCSPDNTNELVEKLLESHPKKHLVRYFNHNVNKGMMLNFTWAVEQASNSKYIALCEGDDFWTDSKKLQKQVRFLDENTNYNLAFHNTLILKPDGNLKKCNDWTIEKTFEFKDFTSSNFANTTSLLYRNNISPFPEWFYNLAAGDWAIILLNAEKGKIYYMPETMATYRLHEGGVWSSTTYEEMLTKGIELMKKLDAVFEYKYNHYFDEGIKKRTIALKNYQLSKKKNLKNWIKKMIKR